MLPGNAKCSMTSLAYTKHIFRKRKIDLYMKPRISQLTKTMRGKQTARGEIIKSLRSALYAKLRSELMGLL